jgi:hypothetical protein
MRQHDRGQRAGLLAADVQRPAAQYRGRYTQVSGEARALLGGGSLKAPAKLGGSLGGTTSYRLPGTPDRTTTDRSAAVVDALLHHRGGSLLKAVTANLDSGEFTRTVPGTPGKTVTMGGETPGLESPAGGGKGSGYLGRVIKRANRIDSKHLPYQWGGGHSPDAKHKTVAARLLGRGLEGARHQPARVGRVHEVGQARPRRQDHRLRQRRARPRRDQRPLLGHQREQPGRRCRLDSALPDHRLLPVRLHREASVGRPFRARDELRP